MLLPSTSCSRPPGIGASLGVDNENHRQYVVSAYLLGFGIAQLFYGPLADRFGRRKPMLFGLGIYIVSSIAVIFVPSFAGLLALRFIQGIGSAATRVITVSIVRDIYGGRQMAEVMSLIMMVSWWCRSLHRGQARSSYSSRLAPDILVHGSNRGHRNGLDVHASSRNAASGRHAP